MSSHEELFTIAERMEAVAASPDLEAADESLRAVEEESRKAGLAFGGSWLGYHASVYYNDLGAPPPGAHFSQEWGLKDMSYSRMGSRGDWREYNPEELWQRLREDAGDPDLNEVHAAAALADEKFGVAKAEIQSILMTENEGGVDTYLTQLLTDLDSVEPLSQGKILQHWSPSGQVATRDMVAVGQGYKVPPHLRIKAEVASIRQSFAACREAAQISRKAASHLERKGRRSVREARIGTNVFIGHGRSAVWRELKDFVQDRLQLPWDEFNRVPVAGVTNQARLSEMLDAAAIALIIMTAEDENSEGQLQARMNVVHEAGLFQGRLGFTRAIVLLEEDCAEFSNIQGLGQIRFPRNNIAACFEEIRRVAEREGLISN